MDKLIPTPSLLRGLADEGKTWYFDRWLILGPASACHTPLSKWPDGFQWQFNDPYLWREVDGSVRMLYSTAEWPEACGNIGIAAVGCGMGSHLP